MGALRGDPIWDWTEHLSPPQSGNNWQTLLPMKIYFRKSKKHMGRYNPKVRRLSGDHTELNPVVPPCHQGSDLLSPPSMCWLPLNTAFPGGQKISVRAFPGYMGFLLHTEGSWYLIPGKDARKGGKTPTKEKQESLPRPSVGPGLLLQSANSLALPAAGGAGFWRSGKPSGRELQTMVPQVVRSLAGLEGTGGRHYRTGHI